MEFTRMQHINATFSLINKSIANIHEYNGTHPGFPMDETRATAYMTKRLVYSMLWGMAGSISLAAREALGPNMCGTLVVVMWLVCVVSCCEREM